MRHVALLGLAAIAVAAIPAGHAAAQGLLHKHRHVAGPGLAAMRPLPTQAAPVVVAATGDVSSSDGAATAAIGTVATNPSLPGAVGGAPGAVAATPGAVGICVVPPAPLDGVPIDAVPMPLPSIDGGPAIACSDYPCIPPGFVPGFVPGADPGVAGHHHTRPLPGGDAAPGGPLMYGRPIGFSAMNAATPSASAFGQAPAAAANAAPPGRHVAAGLPGRAVGVRPGTLDVPGRRQMTPIGGPAHGATVSAGDVQRDPGVVQAAGIAPQHEGATRRAGTAGPATAAAMTATPTRWRDRLHIAWPTAK